MGVLSIIFVILSFGLLAFSIYSLDLDNPAFDLPDRIKKIRRASKLSCVSIAFYLAGVIMRNLHDERLIAVYVITVCEIIYATYLLCLVISYPSYEWAQGVKDTLVDIIVQEGPDGAFVLWNKENYITEIHFVRDSEEIYMWEIPDTTLKTANLLKNYSEYLLCFFSGN